MPQESRRSVVVGKGRESSLHYEGLDFEDGTVPRLECPSDFLLTELRRNFFWNSAEIELRMSEKTEFRVPYSVGAEFWRNSAGIISDWNRLQLKQIKKHAVNITVATRLLSVNTVVARIGAKLVFRSGVYRGCLNPDWGSLFNSSEESSERSSVFTCIQASIQ